MNAPSSVATSDSPQAEYVSIGEALELWQIDPRTLRKKRRQAGIQIYTLPTDDRVRLMRRADLVAALGQPRNRQHR